MAICELFHGFAEKMPQEFYNELINKSKEQPTKKMKKRKNQKEEIQNLQFYNFFGNIK